ncbi:MAG: hypothetical protein LBT55_04660 [Clostridiaceae bacterium]|jgi:hypothetical protein|nr:hypothetical protein [Clostridiaceae bacterium]
MRKISPQKLFIAIGIFLFIAVFSFVLGYFVELDGAIGTLLALAVIASFGEVIFELVRLVYYYVKRKKSDDEENDKNSDL